MWIVDKVKGLFADSPPPAASTRLVSDARPPRMGGRVSVDSETDVFVSALSMLTPAAPDYENYWRDYRLDAKTLDRVPPAKLMQLLADMSPDVSRALWDFLRLGNPGFSVKAYKLGARDANGERVKDETAQGALNTFLGNLHGPYSANNAVHANTVINSLLIACFLRGAMCAELVIDRTGRVPLEIATPDPASIRFRRVADDERGPVWQMGQWQRGEWVSLDRPTIQYVPVDPFPGSPYGRPLASPALFASLFLLGLLHDLRRVVAQQGYPRLDIKIISEKLRASMPDSVKADPAKFKEWQDTAIAEIIASYEGVEPDEAWVHSDVSEFGRPVGVVDSSSLGAVDGLIKGLERLLVRALKTFDLFFDTDNGGSEAGFNRKWELMAASIKSVQHLAENLLEKMCGMALQVQGLSADVEWRFAELRAAELLRDAQVEAFKLKNARTAYDNGLISQDEQAEMALGKSKANVPEPRGAAPSAGNSLPTGGMAADPGSERAVKVNGDAEVLSTEVEQ